MFKLSLVYLLVPFHTTPEEFENEAIFLRLDLPATLIRHQGDVLQKRRSSPRKGGWGGQVLPYMGYMGMCSGIAYGF